MQETTLGEAILSARLRLGLTQKEFCKLCRVKKATIVALENNNNKKLRPLLLFDISKITGLDFYTLLNLAMKQAHSNS